MPWIDDVAGDDMPEMLADTVAAQQKHYGTVLNSTRKLANAPYIQLGANDMSKAFSRSRNVPPRIASLLNLRTGSIVGCPL